MTDPTLKRASVTIKYGASDGYGNEAAYSTRFGALPQAVLLESLEELARLASLFGHGAEAIQRATEAHQRVEQWLAQRKQSAVSQQEQGE